MSDEEFIHAFESLTLPASEFTHTAHVRAGWWYLQRHPLGEAIERFRRSLRAFATAAGAAGKYHETITVAWMVVINERLSGGRELPWADFAAANADLFASRPSVLAQFYDPGTLQSARAQTEFVAPDRAHGMRWL